MHLLALATFLAASLTDFVTAFLSCLCAHFGIGASAHPACSFLISVVHNQYMTDQKFEISNT